MKKGTKLSDILHVLLHIAQSTKPLTSEILAKTMSTNPVVVRRAMAGLRQKGMVRSEKGHSGGWVLSCEPEKVTLLDIYQAIESPTLLAMTNRHEHPDCKVEKAVNTTIGDAFAEAEAMILNSFKGVTLAKLHTHIIGHGQNEHCSCNNKHELPT